MSHQNAKTLSSGRSSLFSYASDPLNLRVIEVAEHFAAVMKAVGYTVKPHSPQALRQLPTVPTLRKLQICAHLELVCTWLNELKAEGGTENIRDSYSEKALLQKAMKHFGLMVDEQFWKVFENHLVTEIYGDNMIQLYRTLNFYELTGYSILDLSMNEWYVLWQRPQRIIEAMMTHGNRVIQANIPLAELPIPKHLNLEIYDSGETEPFVPRAAIVEFRHIAALKTTWQGPAVALICTSEGSLVAEGDEARNIRFV